MSNQVNIEDIADFLGKEVGLTDWIEINQAQINKFADATGDHQYIHVDEDRAAETPFGATIAHGFLTLSLLSKLSSMNGGIKLKNSVMGINYGLDKVRFPAPVPVNSRVRASHKFLSAELKGDNTVQVKREVTIEIEGGNKPVCVAESLIRYMYSD